MKRLWTADELVDEWTLLPSELELLANKTGTTRLGFAVLLKFFSIEGRFPHAKQEVPGAVVAFIARQVGVEPGSYLAYDWRGRTIAYHRAQIREALGFRAATVEDAEDLTAWLRDEMLPREHQQEPLLEAAYGRCRFLRLEPPLGHGSSASSVPPASNMRLDSLATSNSDYLSRHGRSSTPCSAAAVPNAPDRRGRRR